MHRGLTSLALALAACSGPGAEPTNDSGGGPTDPSVDEPLPALHDRPDTRTCQIDGTAASALPRLEARPVASPTFADAVQILAAPASMTGLWVVESSGRIWAVSPSGEDSIDPPQLVVDLSDRVDCCGSRGLLAAAVGPGPELFVHYHRADDPNLTRVSRLSFDPARGVADPSTELVTFELEHEGTAASGGGLAFDADAMLLVGIGDDSPSPPSDPNSSPARDPTDLRGSVLRLDVSSGGPGYAIPIDNPFTADPQSRPELFATGFHDPRNCTTSADTGRSWCSDAGRFGSGARDELDGLISGRDYGWPIVEGSRCALGECEAALFTGPHAEYGLDDPDAAIEHCRITTGFEFPTTTTEPALAGVQLFGDRCSGRGFGLRTSVGPGAVEIVAEVANGIAAVGPSADDQAWLIDGSGQLARVQIADGGQPGTLPKLLSETGCFVDPATHSPGPDLIPYLVAAPLWSDALHKYRYMVVPPGQRVSVRADGRWVFPEASVLIKTFAHQPDPADPSGRRPVETRFMVRRNGAWEFHSYRWNDDASDAQLLDGEAEVTLTTLTAEGSHEFDWTFPDRVACRNCHGFAGGRPLGPTTAQLNRDVVYADDPSTSQLAALTDIDLLEFDVGVSSDPEQAPALADPRDPAAPVADRARAYLETNCAPCHRPQWLAPDLRASTPLAATGLCDPIAFPSPWVAGELRLEPGAPDGSNLWMRMATRGDGQMPPLGTAVVDVDALALVGDWIAELESCD